MISKRHVQANNPIVGNNDQEQALSYIVEWDANNLYGCAMSQVLRLNPFTWVPKEEWDLINWQRLGDESNQGYIIGCDLEYTPEIHYAHNDYPLAAERLDIHV